VSESDLVLHAAQEVGRTFGPYLSLVNAAILFLIWMRLAQASVTLAGLLRTLDRLEATIDRTTKTVTRHAEAIARLEGWLDRHNHDGAAE